MFIDGIGIAGYKSFGREVQRIGPFEKINVFIGQNNSGKSNILLFLARHYETALTSANDKSINWGFDNSVDRHQYLGDSFGKLIIEFGVKIEGKNFEALMKKYEHQLRREDSSSYFKRLLDSETLRRGTNLIWFCYEAEFGGQLTLSPTMIGDVVSERVLEDNEWRALWNVIPGSSGGGAEQQWIHDTLSALRPTQFKCPGVDLVPTIRKIGDAGSTPDDFSGIGIIDRLAKLQNPPHDRQELKDRFNEINEFVRQVTENRTAKLEIPYGRDMILVHMDNKTLPLSSLGTGIHEVIILAAAATVLQDQIICIEEPELHLHPLLQKKLIQYLQEKTNNQYFISTHSAHLVDTADAAIFHVRLRNGQSIVDQAYTPTEKSQICADLGYRASDLMQSNCIIWVEGPSDRIYLNHWIHAIKSDLIEGVHYSIMFYGGRLLSHLSAKDPEVEEFISLRRLNRYIIIIIDSDKSKLKDQINATKRRVEKEFNEGPGFAWITKGREIENYIDAKILEEAIKHIYKDAEELVNTRQYDECLYFRTKNGTQRKVDDKVKLAKEVVNNPANLNVLGLKRNVENLVKFICESNDLLRNSL